MTDTFAVPELMRGLRGFASPGSLGTVHDRFFGPLLDARRAATRARSWNDRLSAFDAERLEATIKATLGSFAADQFPGSAPDRRALAAELDEACGDLYEALVALGIEQQRVRAAGSDADRGHAWSVWVTALKEVFSSADRGWEHIKKLLDATHTRGRAH